MASQSRDGEGDKEAPTLSERSDGVDAHAVLVVAESGTGVDDNAESKLADSTNGANDDMRSKDREDAGNSLHLGRSGDDRVAVASPDHSGSSDFGTESAVHGHIHTIIHSNFVAALGPAERTAVGEDLAERTDVGGPSDAKGVREGSDEGEACARAGPEGDSNRGDAVASAQGGRNDDAVCIVIYEEHVVHVLGTVEEDSEPGFLVVLVPVVVYTFLRSADNIPGARNAAFRGRTYGYERVTQM